MGMTFNELLYKAPLLAKELGLNSLKVKLILDMMSNGKIAKPSVEFKAITGKLSEAGKKPFLYLKGKKGGFFIPNLDFPVSKKDMNARLTAVKKLLKKASDNEKLGLEAQQIFFETLLDQIKKKKLLATYGKVAFKGKDDLTKRCFLSLEGMVKGEHNSAEDLANEIDSIGGDLVAKNGDILSILLNEKEDVEELASSGMSNSSEPSPNTDTDVVEESEDQSLDVEALAAMGLDLVSEYKAFSITEMAAVKSEKSAKSVLVALDKGKEIAKKFADWQRDIGHNTDPRLKKAIASVDRRSDILSKMLEKLEAKAQEINSSGDGTSGTRKLTEKRRTKMKANMNKISARLDAIAQRLGVV